jgi:hypothetical protein
MDDPNSPMSMLSRSSRNRTKLNGSKMTSGSKLKIEACQESVIEEANEK